VAVPKLKSIAAQRRKSQGGKKKEKKSIAETISQYLKEVRSEFRKIVWPNRQQVVSSTAVVIVVFVFFAILTAFFDFIFSQLVRTLLPLIGG
jgi:preprotein translocase subunit SecE